VPRDPLARVVLKSVHPLYGGWSVWLRGDGKLLAIKVARGGFMAKRFEALATPEEMAGLEGMLESSKFWDLPPPTLKQPPMPDETWVEMYAELKSGIKASVGKFARQKSRRFDPIQQAVMTLVARAEEAGTVSEGRYDPYEMPKGY
jgi:hypothetical protein